MVELTDFLNRKLDRIVWWTKAESCFGSCYCQRANVFLMDEPLSNLDAKLRVSTRAQIKNLNMN